MKYYFKYFDDEIEEKPVQKLINELSEREEQVTLYFTTVGGDASVMEMLIDFLNNNSDKIDVVLTYRISSAGTYLLTDLKKAPKLADNLDYIMFHNADYASHQNTQYNGYYSEDSRQRNLRIYNEKYINKYRELGLTKKELDVIREGGMVYLYAEDFKRLNLKP